MAELQFDLTGREFGKLKVMWFRSRRGWWCECKCGTADYYQSSHLRDGRSTSCGCARYTDRKPYFDGIIIDAEGYAWAWAPDHPKSRAGRVRQHVIVMEEELGRLLTDDELVHHRNRVRNDNRIDNLELWSTSHPTSARVEDLVTWAEQILALYKRE